MIRIVVLILFLIKTSASFAQQPAYFVLGENQFKGLKVFDIIQDLDQNYYFATNEGIVKYDFIKYTKVEIKSAKSVAFFNFTISKFGIIYFNNLNNQIFSIQNGKCKLFYELKGNESSNLIQLLNDNAGNLIIGCKGLIVLDTAANVITQITLKTALNTNYKLNSSTWMFPISEKDSVLIYTHGKLSNGIYKTSNFDPKKNILLQFFDYNDSCYALDLNSKSLFTFDKVNWILTKIKSADFFNSSTNARLYINGNKIWSPTSISGINFSDVNFNTTYQKFYQDYFISDVFEDKEGNILLGTFDKGVLVIPNVKIQDVINPFALDPMISIYTDENNDVYLGSNKGILNRYKNNKLEIISANNKKPIEGIYGSPMSDVIIFDDGIIKGYNKKTKEIYDFLAASLKDVAFISANEMYLGTNYGIKKVKLNSKNNYQITMVKNMNFRIYSLAYNQNQQLLYCSTANGLFALDKNGESKKILYQGKDIYSEKLFYSNGILYAISRELGILIIDNKNKISVIKPQLPVNDESIKNIFIYKNSILLSTSNGLYQLNKEGAIIYQYHSAYGFTSKKIYSFSVVNNDLWVSHTGGVQKIDLTFKHFEKQIPQIKFQELRVNNKIINFDITHNFNSSERKFEFVIYSPTLRNIENIKYHYKLIGYDEQWQTQSYKLNNIIYNALSPGQYTLVIKAENLGIFSPEKKYSFTISSPIYAKLWFIISSIVLFLFIVFLIYRWQLNRQKQKSKQINELNLSKLTAIQSQMNPHFIFNSLNSIQDLVLQQNAPKAYDSIGKFALLIRKIMHHSEKEFIDIEEELSIIHVYLELELLRFKKDFNYEIRSNDLADIEIPPMLIQPYIENAIKHGLLHKTGEKKLLIEMRLEEDAFVCEITDNGIGRKKSKEMKERQKNMVESFSGNSLNKRLSILKKHFGGDFGVEIIDLYDTDNNAIGTKVILKAPYKQKY